MKSNTGNSSCMLFISAFEDLTDCVPKNQLAVISPTCQELQLRHHIQAGNHFLMSLYIVHLSLRVCLNEPLVYFLVFSCGVEHLVYWVPRHAINLNRKLMYHGLVLILRLCRDDRVNITYIIAPNIFITATDH